jgi:hypothetical protein
LQYLPEPWGQIMSDNSTPITLVVFRRWDTGSLIALFPQLPADCLGIYCDAYEHVGQHGGADYYGVIQATKPVSLENAADLIQELKRIGYRLKPITRASQRVHEARRATARSYRP